MASREQNNGMSSTNEEIPLHNIECREDEYGYVDPVEKRISRELIGQLPSHQINLEDDPLPIREYSDHSFKRRFSLYKTMHVKACSSLGDVEKLFQLLNADPAATQDEKLKTLREMHQSLSVKRRVKEKLDTDLRLRRGSQELDKFTRLKLRTNQVWHRMLFEFKNKLYSLELWHNPIKAVQGQFGSAVASYFIFLRWLLYINVGNFLLSIFFIITPQVAFQFSKDYNSSETRFNYTAEKLVFSDFITGSGWLSDSLMYFGHYTHRIIYVVPGWPYNMPLAYLLTIGVNSVINLIAVSYSLTSAYQKNYVDMSGDIKHIFCNKIFAAWDYSIETEDAANLKKMAFCNEIKELLAFKRQRSMRKNLSQKIIDGCLMVIFNLLSLGITGAVGFLTYFLLSKKLLEGGILREMTLSLVVTTVSISFFFLLEYFTKLENYLQRKTKVYLTMIRVTLLRTVMLGIIVYFWMVGQNSVKEMHDCFETELGKEIYRLILVNFLITVVACTFCKDVLVKIIHNYISTVKISSFDVAFNTLDLIYVQTLAWVGCFSMPFSPLIVIIILVSLFYIKLATVVSCCRPPKRTWSVNEAQTFFLILTFFMFILTAFTVGYVLFALKPSACGPFKQYQHTSDIIHEVFFQRDIHQSSEIVKYVTSPGVMFAFFCALCVVVYFMRAQAKAHISVEKKVREQLVMEGKDKVFLLKLFEEALVAHSQAKKNENQDVPLPENSSSPSHESNRPYHDYYNLPPSSSMSKNSEFGESEASESPVRQVDPRIRSPLVTSNGRDSPARKAKGINVPSHQPGFRYFREDDFSRT